MAGIVAQRQVAGEQGGGDDEAAGGQNPDPGMDDTALGQRHRAEQRRGVKQQHRRGRRQPRGVGLMR